MRIIIIISLAVFLIFPEIITVQAQGGTTIQTLPTNISVIGSLYNLANWLWTILLIVAVIFIIVGAYYFVTAAGNPDQMTKARSMILYAAIGVVVAGIAWGIVSIARRVVTP